MIARAAAMASPPSSSRQGFERLAKLACFLVGPHDPEGMVVGAASLPSSRRVETDTGSPVARIPATVRAAPPILEAERVAREGETIAPPRCHIVELEDAVVVDGMVRTAQGQIVRESLINRDVGDLPRPHRFARKRSLRGRPHVLLKQRWDQNYGHWLIEALPRLAPIQDRYDLSDLRFIVSRWPDPALARIYEESLALFGVRANQIVAAADEPLRVAHLIYPTPMTEHPWRMAPRCIEVLEQLATRVQSVSPPVRRLYVSRNGAGRRRLVNEHEILPIVRRRGFKVVAPELLSLYGQIGLFRGATEIVGSYGAALTNVAFTDAQPRLLALTSPWMQDDFFSSLMSLKQGSFTSLHGDLAQGATAHRDSDFRIDPVEFAATLDAWL